MRLKYRPEDFAVHESWRFDEVPGGGYIVYAMDKQKLSTFEAVDRIAKHAKVARSALSFCGLKDKQGRTEQLIALKGDLISLQDPDLKLRVVGETDHPLSSKNTTSNRFNVTVRDLDPREIDRLPEAVAEVNRLGVVNYFDSQRFGHLKHGQGFIAKDLLKGEWEHALHNLIAQPSPLDTSSDLQLKTFWKAHWGQWSAHGPQPDSRTYNILKMLRANPKDFKKAFLTIEPRYRALVLFTYQSYLWNEGVKLMLLELLPRKALCQIAYQVGALLFPREVPPGNPGLLSFLRTGSFPLLGPDSGDKLRQEAKTPGGLSDISDGLVRAVNTAVETTLRREKLTLPGLHIPDAPMFFKHEERALTVVPGKLVVSTAERDEYFRGRSKVRLSFTLPSGSYATLVVRRLFWFSEAKEREPLPVPVPVVAVPATAAKHQDAQSFLEKKRARRAVRDAARQRQATQPPASTKDQKKAKGAKKAGHKKAARK